MQSIFILERANELKFTHMYIYPILYIYGEDRGEDKKW